MTNRRPLIDETLGTKSRKTFACVNVGFINTKVASAKCPLLPANRVGNLSAS